MKRIICNFIREHETKNTYISNDVSAEVLDGNVCLIFTTACIPKDSGTCMMCVTLEHPSRGCTYTPECIRIYADDTGRAIPAARPGSRKFQPKLDRHMAALAMNAVLALQTDYAGDDGITDQCRKALEWIAWIRR